jgi:hypothetical protein
MLAMDLQVFKFPVLQKDDLEVIEAMVCNLINRHRQGDLLPEEVDWLDWANTVLCDVSVVMETNKRAFI